MFGAVRWDRTLMACLVLFSLGGGHAVASPTSESEWIEPEAGGWTTWLLSSGSELRLAPPPGTSDTRAELAQLRTLAAERDTAMTDRISFWDAGAPPYRWTQRAVQYAENHGVGTNRAGRLFALLNVATYDATIAAWDSKYTYNRPRPAALNASVAAIPSPASPSYPDERAVAAGAASTVLAYIFPADADLFGSWADEAAQSRVEAGVAYPSDVAAGLALGRQVGDRAVAWGMADGSDAIWTGSVPDEPGKWKGTNPIEPLAGTWKPWALQSGSQFRPGPPPALDSPKMASDLAEVKNYSRTNLTNLTASFWEYYGGRGSFEYWNDQVSRAIFDYRLDSNPPLAARIYAAADIAFQDSFIACWDAKFTYWAPRPPMVDPSITTVFVTPNHPSYPSAHSCISTAVGSVLARAFPRDADYYKGLAVQAGEARIMAGIHFRSDVNAGALLGQQVAGVVLERMGDVQAP